jgi:hypothetical protein
MPLYDALETGVAGLSMKRILLLSAAISVLTMAEAQAAVTCQDGLEAIEGMARIMDLSDFEQANIQALLAKAKLEGDKGKQRNCKLILADAIRFFLIKSVMQ